jgi:hypothetical protein
MEAVARALQSPKPVCASNAGGVLSCACAADAGLAGRAVAAPGILRALVALLRRGPDNSPGYHAACVLCDMAAGDDGDRPDLAARVAAEDGLLPALAAFAHRTSSQEAIPAVRALAAIARAGGDRVASRVGRSAGAVPALVRALREGGGATVAIPALEALATIADASPPDLRLHILDAGAADAAVAAVARAHGRFAPPPTAGVADLLGVMRLGTFAGALLKFLAAVDAAAVTAPLARLLASSDAAQVAFARDLLAAPPLSMGPVALKALVRQAQAAAQARARAAALEALAAASAAEADAARPQLCAACGKQSKAAGAGRLRPCAGCSGKGPAGRVQYCGADLPARPLEGPQGLLQGGGGGGSCKGRCARRGRLRDPPHCTILLQGWPCEHGFEASTTTHRLSCLQATSDRLERW